MSDLNNSIEAAGAGSHLEPASPSSLSEVAIRRALDELFSLTHQYRQSKAYFDLLQFVARFRYYSPFNALLIHMQMPGARFVASANRWLSRYGRDIRPGARPVVILQPRGPVMFVFDVSDTEARDGAPPLPREVLAPFEVRGGKVGAEFDRTIENAKRDGVRISRQPNGAQRAGSIAFSPSRGAFLQVLTRRKPAEYAQMPLRYELLLNDAHPAEVQYATLVHELAHLYCGHLGTPNQSWWPDRRGIVRTMAEFEAESVSYLVCLRRGIRSPSEEYLATFIQHSTETPPISLECVMKAVGLIETMGREHLKPRVG